MFDRDWEWSRLERFVTDDQPGATLGTVSVRQALHALLELGRDRAVPVILDEFLYLVGGSGETSLGYPEGALATFHATARIEGTVTAVRFVDHLHGDLLAGDAPLRGRAGLELVVP